MDHDGIKTVISDRLYQADRHFERLSVDYRVVGSIGLAGFGIFDPFYERDASIPEARLPDIDIIVARSDLAAARELRDLSEHQDVPVRIGLAIPSLQVDLSFDGSSRLTAGRRSLEVDSTVFARTDVAIDNLDFPSVPPETLRHIYGQFSPNVMARTDKLTALDRALGVDGQHENGSPYGVFHDYAYLISRHPPLSRRAMDGFDMLERHLHPTVAAKARSVATRISSGIGWR